MVFLRLAWRRRYLIVLAFAAMLFSGCAGRSLYPKVGVYLKSGDCDQAADIMARGGSEYGSNARLLYLLDSAMVSLQCGAFDTAQQRLHEAEELAQALWTESISRNAASMVTNDYVMPYGGEDYERVMIHVVSAIGYMIAEQLDEALVEVRRLDSLLEMYDRTYAENTVYKKDAFGRYLSGMLREAEGGTDDAFIDYYLAAGIYANEWQRYHTPMPEALAEDLLRMAQRVGRMEEARLVLPEQVVSRFAPAMDEDGLGKVVVLVFNGEGPYKIQDTAIVSIKYGPVTIAFPKIITGTVPCSQATFHLSNDQGAAAAPMALAADINEIARKSLEDKKGRIVAKALARATAKQVAIHGIANSSETKEQKQAVATLLNIFNAMVLEKADLRCWRTLPGQILTARIMAEPGSYEVQVEMCQNQTYNLGNVTLNPGETRFVLLDTRYGPVQP
ncbi:MAG: hypothetical protein HKP58_17070 [Desulfatitalea sp.]|nr:hypothetical protein [Desulfatitalea sp.]NNK02126.1 hypothetical protein [Desulfatitalea sp.]